MLKGQLAREFVVIEKEGAVAPRLVCHSAPLLGEQNDTLSFLFFRDF